MVEFLEKSIEDVSTVLFLTDSSKVHDKKEIIRYEVYQCLALILPQY